MNQSLEGFKKKSMLAGGAQSGRGQPRDEGKLAV